MNKKPTHKEVESELEEIISGGKPKIIAARLPSMPIPDYIDRHLRGKNIKYLCVIYNLINASYIFN